MDSAKERCRALTEQKLVITERIAALKARGLDARGQRQFLPRDVWAQHQAEIVRLGVKAQAIQIELGALAKRIREENAAEAAAVRDQVAARKAANVAKCATADRHFRYLARARMPIDVYNEIYAEAERRAEIEAGQGAEIVQTDGVANGRGTVS